MPVPTTPGLLPFYVCLAHFALAFFSTFAHTFFLSDLQRCVNVWAALPFLDVLYFGGLRGICGTFAGVDDVCDRAVLRTSALYLSTHRDATVAFVCTDVTPHFALRHIQRLVLTPYHVHLRTCGAFGRRFP